ncbi:MAG: PorP/SprF family type IX secretion system membrane protein [Paludibacteraceae bacterium]|nr:PorP/SprF family type IX secretion system membrane protein [Paludibacteraceae bacterium]
MKQTAKQYIVLLFVLCGCALRSTAQTDPQIGQYMFLPSTYNPAAAAEDDLMHIVGMHRLHTTGMSDMPMTTYFTVSAPFHIANTKHGVGARFLNDLYGLYTNQSFHVQYAYRHKIGNGVLCAGIELGFANIRFKVDKVNLDSIANLEQDGFHHSQNEDPAIPAAGSGKDGVNGMSFDMALGLYYKAPKWWAALSYSHLNRPKVEWNDHTYMTLVGTMYAAGGYNWRMPNHDWMLRPSLMLMTDFASWDVNLTLIAEVKQRYRFGAGYRAAGSINFIFGVDIVSGLQLGYTYELPANKLIKGSFGAHEIYLAYGLDILKPKHTNRYKSIRYL